MLVDSQLGVTHCQSFLRHPTAGFRSDTDCRWAAMDVAQSERGSDNPCQALSNDAVESNLYR